LTLQTIFNDRRSTKSTSKKSSSIKDKIKIKKDDEEDEENKKESKEEVIEIEEAVEEVEELEEFLVNVEDTEIQNIILCMTTNNPDFTHEPESAEKTKYAGLRKAARQRSKSASTIDAKLKNYARISIINYCQTFNVTIECCIKLINFTKEDSFKLSDKVIKHLKEVYTKT